MSQGWTSQDCVALQVARVEFMMFILENLNLVGREEMGKILELFDSMDRTRDGFLTLQVQASNICTFICSSCHLFQRTLQTGAAETEV